MSQKWMILKILSALSLCLAMTGCTPASMSASNPATAPTTSNPVKSSGPNGNLVCGCGGSCTSTSGDGLPDTWKNIGVDSNCDGVVDLDLAAMGAKVGHRDIFLQMDYMSPRPDDGTGQPGPSFKPEASAIDTLVNSFANSPVQNQDGTTGINLHVVLGSEIPHALVTTLIDAPSRFPSCVGSDAVGLPSLKAKYLDPSRALAFHYAVVADYSGCDSDQDCQTCPFESTFGQSGIAQMNSTDFIISLGQLVVDFGIVPDDAMVAGTIMHELGHNLGLHHGGGLEDGPNFKPNYLSVMNYLYQMNGIPTQSGANLIDYSRQALANLNETTLDENVGLGSKDPSLMFYFFDQNCTWRKASASGPIDWNGNGIIDVALESIDLNPPDHANLGCGSVHNQVLNGHEDWSILDYGFYSHAKIASNMIPDVTPDSGCANATELVLLKDQLASAKSR